MLFLKNWTVSKTMWSRAFGHISPNTCRVRTRLAKIHFWAFQGQFTLYMLWFALFGPKSGLCRQSCKEPRLCYSVFFSNLYFNFLLLFWWLWAGVDNYSEMSHLSAKTRVAGPATCFPLSRALVTFFFYKPSSNIGLFHRRMCADQNSLKRALLIKLKGKLVQHSLEW